MIERTQQKVQQKSTHKKEKKTIEQGLEYSSIVWNPMLKKDIEMLEKVQKRFTKRIPGLKCLTCQRLARLKLDSL